MRHECTLTENRNRSTQAAGNGYALAAHRILFLLAGRPVNYSRSTCGQLAEKPYWYRSRMALTPFTTIKRKMLRAKRVCGVGATDPPRAGPTLMSQESG